MRFLQKLYTRRVANHICTCGQKRSSSSFFIFLFYFILFFSLIWGGMPYSLRIHTLTHETLATPTEIDFCVEEAAELVTYTAWRVRNNRLNVQRPKPLRPVSEEIRTGRIFFLDELST